MRFLQKVLSKTVLPKLTIKNDAGKVGLIEIGSKHLTVEEFQNSRDLKVAGYLTLSDTKITSLPEGLQVGGGLYLNYTKITSLPKDLKVAGFLDLRDTKITALPEGLKVGGNIIVDDISKISCSPELRKKLL